ncbi:MAG: radical SAM protein [Akkermansia sp.]|nr:radical SAM protein [Akkermansia sp.]
MKELALTPRIESLSPVDKRKNRTCTLMITQRCNLNCSYCYERFKSHRSMDFPTAKRCLEEELRCVESEKQRFSWLLVELFGGEPLLNFPLIQQVVAWARESVHSVPLMFMVITNGTLLTDSVREWFRNNKDMIVLTVSYDGSSLSQMTNRRCSAESALEFCHREWPDMSFRMTVSPESVETLAQDIKASFAAGYTLRAQLAHGVQWSEHARCVLERELRELKAFYLHEPTALPALLAPFFTGAEDSPSPCSQKCGAGCLKVCYDVDGAKYPCSMFSPVSAGERALPYHEYRYDDASNHNDPFCVDCPIKHSCYTCPASNHIHRNAPAVRDHSMCRVNLTLALVALEFQSECLIQRGLTPESASLLKSYLRLLRKVKLSLQASLPTPIPESPSSRP